MIQERARVVAVGEGHAWVEIQRQTHCNACSANRSCGTAVLASVLGQRRSRIYALSPIPLKAGDEVIIGMPEHALLRGALVVYLVPLLALFMGAVIGRAAFPFHDEPLILLFGALGLIAGFVWLWSFARRIDTEDSFHPLILGRSPL